MKFQKYSKSEWRVVLKMAHRDLKMALFRYRLNKSLLAHPKDVISKGARLNNCKQAKRNLVSQVRRVEDMFNLKLQRGEAQ